MQMTELIHKIVQKNSLQSITLWRKKNPNYLHSSAFCHNADARADVCADDLHRQVIEKTSFFASVQSVQIHTIN
jgi:hypothetical protein